jgi:gamma-D-glutamyl-L-lysine dipeptidyl-peptidase
MPETVAHVTIRSTVAPLVGEPRVAAPQISQLIRGHSAELLARQDAWYRIRGVDGYEGWCHQGYLCEPVPVSTQIRGLRSGWTDEQRMSLGCTIRRDDGSQIALPLGALLGTDEVVVAGLAMNARGRKRYFASDARLLVRRAVDLFAGTPYQWGGVTPWGADCSGFVQTMFALHGMQLPRDAWQQGELGKNVPGDLRELYPADLLFFSDRDDAKITHVAVSLGGSSVVHVSLANGGYGIDAVDAPTAVAQQLQKTFQFAKRIL